MTKISVKPKLIEFALQSARETADSFIEKHPEMTMIKGWIEDWLNCKYDDGTEIAVKYEDLSSFAKKVNIPFTYFFIETIPDPDISPLTDVRANADQIKRDFPLAPYSRSLLDTYYKITRMQDFVIDFGDRDIRPSKLAGAGRDEDKGHRFFSNALDFSPIDYKNLPPKCSSIDELLLTQQDILSHLIKKIEEAGVYVVISPWVPYSANRYLDINDFASFSIMNKIAPFIFVNSNGLSVYRQIYHLIHGAASIYFGLSKLMSEDSSKEFKEKLPSVNEDLPTVLTHGYLYDLDIIYHYPKGEITDNDFFERQSSLKFLSKLSECLSRPDPYDELRIILNSSYENINEIAEKYREKR